MISGAKGCHQPLFLSPSSSCSSLLAVSRLVAASAAAVIALALVPAVDARALGGVGMGVTAGLAVSNSTSSVHAGGVVGIAVGVMAAIVVLVH